MLSRKNNSGEDLQETRGERFGSKTYDLRYELSIDNKSEGVILIKRKSCFYKEEVDFLESDL